MFQIDREKYIEIMRTHGLDAALTALHIDKDEWEFETFEGSQGYQRELWDALFAVREFSRELWDLSLRETPKSPSSSDKRP